MRTEITDEDAILYCDFCNTDHRRVRFMVAGKPCEEANPKYICDDCINASMEIFYKEESEKAILFKDHDSHLKKETQRVLERLAQLDAVAATHSEPEHAKDYRKIFKKARQTLSQLLDD